MLVFLTLAIALCTTKKSEDNSTTADKASEIISTRTLGLAYLEENKLEEAEDQFVKLTRLAPEEALGYANLGLVYLRMGELGKAEEQLKKAIELSPGDTDIRLNLTRVYEMSGKREEAIATLNDNLKIDEDDVKTLYALAEMFATGQEPDARRRREEYLNRIVALRPTNLAARLPLVETLLRNEKPDKALENLEAIERLAPEMPADAREYYDNAIHYLRSADIRQALTSVIILHNFLKLTNEYQSGIDDLKGEKGTNVGAPIITFSQSMPAYTPEGSTVLDVIRFTDASAAAGLPAAGDTHRGSLAAHIAVTDIDRDTDVDVYFGMIDSNTGRYTHALMQNEMGRFTDITGKSGIDHDDLENAAVFGDYNNDGHLDLFIALAKGSKLYFNKDVGVFTDRTKKTNTNVSVEGREPVFFDYDHDGDLDLFIAGTPRGVLLRNNADDTFTETSISGIDGSDMPSSGACFADFDDDGDTDLLLTGAGDGNRLYTNRREGRFMDVSREALPSLDGNFAGATIGDYNNDGFTDLFMVSAEPGGHMLLMNKGNGTFEHDRQQPLLDAIEHIAGEDARFFDFDNDGFLDLLIVGHAADEARPAVTLLHNSGRGNFEATQGILPEHVKTASSIAVADYNLDGDLDIFLAGDQGIILLRNDGGNANRHLKVQLVGVRTGSGKNNFYGVGAKVEMRSGELYQMRTVTGENAYFGMAQKERADVVRIQWPNGTAQNIFSPGSDQDLVEEQILKGSCPFLYAWDGKKFAFVKDVMWRSALGMPMGIMGGNTTYAFAEASRDYIKINGKKIQPRDGQYVLQLTGELWETLYIDEVKLIAADHPDSIEIYVNEAFSPPPFPDLDVYAVSQTFAAKSASNHVGNDVRKRIAHQDDVYLADFRHGDYQGITDTTALILDPGTDQTEGLLLFLNGWIFPTDASINKAMSQSSKDGVLPPRIEVIDANGEWETAVENLGFPMGKDKTIVVDISDIYRSDSKVLRIRTNQEIYWDHVFFGYRLSHTPMDTSVLSLSEADLHYRGFSKMYRKGGRHGPHWFDYDQVDSGQKWRDLSGMYTRYGDVAPLMETSDNRYVIANAGDEITMRFIGAGIPLPADWKRDFLIYTVGWVKDGDMNTATGNTVQPLPYHGMAQYPYDHSSVFSEDEELKRYQRTYNTRKITADKFRNAIRAHSP